MSIHAVNTSSWRQAAAVLMGSAALATSAAAADDAAQLTLGKQLFMSGTTPACAVCHTLNDAGSQGAIGPLLDELKPDAARVAKAVMGGIGQMPPFGDKLSEAQIAALAAYVAKATGAAP